MFMRIYGWGMTQPMYVYPHTQEMHPNKTNPETQCRERVGQLLLPHGGPARGGGSLRAVARARPRYVYWVFLGCLCVFGGRVLRSSVFGCMVRSVSPSPTPIWIRAHTGSINSMIKLGEVLSDLGRADEGLLLLDQAVQRTDMRCVI